MTRIIAPCARAIEDAVGALNNNEIVVVPTIRWYMLCCKATAWHHIEQILAAKKRPSDRHPLLVVPRKEIVKDYFRTGIGVFRLIDALWPGEMSLLLQWQSSRLADQFRGIASEAALVYNPPGLLGAVALNADFPLAATTVNFSGSLEPNDPGPAISIDEVSLFLEKSRLDVSVVIDSGICPVFMPTTIVDCRDPSIRPTIVRPGYVHERAVTAALSGMTQK